MVTTAISDEISLHDAELLGVNINRQTQEGNLEFYLTDGRRVIAELHGLKAFRGEDLILQNVVSRVLQSTENTFSLDEIGYWLDWVTSLSDTPSWLNNQFKHDWTKAIELGTLALIVFEPSFGAQIGAVCEKMVIRYK